MQYIENDKLIGITGSNSIKGINSRFKNVSA